MDAEEGGPFQCRPRVHSNADPGVPKKCRWGVTYNAGFHRRRPTSLICRRPADIRSLCLPAHRSQSGRRVVAVVRWTTEHAQVRVRAKPQARSRRLDEGWARRRHSEASARRSNSVTAASACVTMLSTESRALSMYPTAFATAAASFAESSCPAARSSSSHKRMTPMARSESDKGRRAARTTSCTFRTWPRVNGNRARDSVSATSFRTCAPSRKASSNPLKLVTCAGSTPFIASIVRAARSKFAAARSASAAACLK